KGIKDECSRLLEASTMKSRRGFAIQRLMNAMRQAHADGWFIVFDTLTLADDRLEAFYDNPNALRDYFRDIGRMVLAAEGRKANDSLLLVWLIFFMVLIKLLPILGTISGKTVKLMVLALICLGNNRRSEERRVGKECRSRW